MAVPGPTGNQEEDPEAVLSSIEEQLNDLDNFTVNFIDGVGTEIDQGMEDFGNHADGAIEHVNNDLNMELQNFDFGGFFDQIDQGLAVDFFQPDTFLENVNDDMESESLTGIGDALSAIITFIRKIAEFISFDWLSQENLDDLAQALARFIVKYAKHMAQETASEAGGEGEGGSSGGSGGGGGGYAWPEWGPSGRYRP